jgi:two-component system chemotaxis response regulator CheB
MSLVRALVVDDSPTMRRLVSDCLARDPDIAVIATAANAQEARAAIKELNPDVMTLDVEMPGMDGLSFLEKVMTLRPMPVVMVSTLTEKGSDAAIAALAIGAVDCVVKPSVANQNSFDELAAKVKMAARSKPGHRVPVRIAPMVQSAPFQAADKVVAIGSSTGGVEALISVLSQLPANCAPTVITQHMPGSFTRSLASRLDRICAATVTEASHGAPLRPGHIYLAPGGETHLEISGRGGLGCVLRRGELVNGHRPSVDVLFHSVARTAAGSAVGVILTGMGRDGAEGLAAMRRAGARTIGQNEATSVVYGMPKAAYEIGAVDAQMPLERIGAGIIAATLQS